MFVLPWRYPRKDVNSRTGGYLLFLVISELVQLNVGNSCFFLSARRFTCGFTSAAQRQDQVGKLLAVNRFDDTRPIVPLKTIVISSSSMTLSASIK
jgi:hypothetical protein